MVGGEGGGGVVWEVVRGKRWVVWEVGGVGGGEGEEVGGGGGGGGGEGCGWW